MNFKESLANPTALTNTKFLSFEPLHTQMSRKRLNAHECRKTWIQANFENIDPKFYKKWKL